MKLYMPLFVAVVEFACCSVLATPDSEHTSTAPSTNALPLTCMAEGSTLWCALRNITTNSIQYSSYTIGYYEAVILERYDIGTRSWKPVPRDREGVFWISKGVGASETHVRSATPGALVLPERPAARKAGFSFSINLDAYKLPPALIHQLRVTQVMGTLLGSDLPVWKGRVVSSAIEYLPHESFRRHYKSLTPWQW